MLLMRLYQLNLNKQVYRILDLFSTTIDIINPVV